MYCPECKAEYREGFNICADCQTPLIAGPLPEEEDFGEGYHAEEGGLRILLETSHPTSLDPIVVRLEEEGVPYILQSGTALSVLEGRLVEMLPEDWKAVLLVPSELLEKARRIAEEPQDQEQPQQPPVEEDD